MKNTDVIILCGGEGTRFRGEGEIKPKPLIEVGGKPILWHIMKYYSGFGFRRFLLALGYKGEEFKRYFYDYRFLSHDLTIRLNPDIPPQIHSPAGEEDWEVVCVDTGVKTLKGGRVRRLLPFIQSDCFHLTYGDGLSNVDLEKLDAFHRRHGKIGTVTSVRPPSRFGEMEVEGDKVLSFEEKPQLSRGNINGGFFVFEKGLMEFLSTDANCDLEFGALQRLASKEELRAFRHEGYWQCMDTMRDKEYLEKLWQSGRAPWKTW